MRTLLAVASITLLVGAGFGCGDDTTTTPVSDLSAVADMTMPHDMMQLNCGQIATCAANATSAAAAGACVSEGKTSSQGLLQTMLGCALTACGSTDGGGTGMCSGLGDTSAGCQNCIKGIVQSGVAGSGPCVSSVQACFADM
jgi:hypothetical protein